MQIYLRALEPNDHLIVNKWRNQKELQVLTSGTLFPVSVEKERLWATSKSLENYKEIYWAICLLSDSRMVGYISLNNIDYIHRKADWGGIMVGDEDARNNNVAFEATFLMLDFAFSQLNLRRVVGYWLAENLSSIMLGRSLGFQKEGLLRSSIYKNGKYYDQVIMSILSEDFFILKEEFI